jgi:hypothetical protein
MEYIAAGAGLLAFLWFYTKERDHDGRHTTIETDGYTQWRTNERNLQDDTRSLLGPDYVFLDYKYTIKGCSLTTFHRDVTSAQKFHGTQHPTYTLIQYHYDGDFLSICPKSHQQYPFAWCRPVNISGRRGTCVLFNADMLHAGMPNQVGGARHVVQYKIVHRDDLDKVAHLQSLHVTKEAGVESSWVWRRLSYYNAWWLHILFAPLMERAYATGVSAVIQAAAPDRFYNNE